MKKYLLPISAIFLLLTTLTAHGLGGGKGYVAGNFWGADLNRNERLDRDEAKSVYNLADDEIYEKYDMNSDGYINFTEFSYFMQQSPWVKSFTHPSEY